MALQEGWSRAVAMKRPNLNSYEVNGAAVSDSSMLQDRGWQMSGKSLLSQMIKIHSPLIGGNKRFQVISTNIYYQYKLHQFIIINGNSLA